MASFNKEIKSNRLLQSLRYTRANTDSGETFTRVLDLNASEIYSQQNLIPVSGIPYSASAQNGSTLIGTDGSTPIAKYYYRLKMTPSNTGEPIFFSIDPVPAAAANPQSVDSNQVVNWISNKYITPVLAGTANAESSPAGYTVIISQGSNTASAADVNANFYQFDYKTGVLQFTDDTKFTGPNLYISGYEYLGRTLSDNDTQGYSGSFSGSFQGDGNGLTNLPASSIVGLNLSQIASSDITASVSTGTTSFNVTDGGTSLFKIGSSGGFLASGDSVVTGSLEVTQNLVVQGTASISYLQSVTGSAKIIGDAFIILNADSPAERYAGLQVYDSGSGATGSLLYDAELDHWFYDSTTEGYASGLMAGPRALTRDAITWPSKYSITRGDGGNHIVNSNIYSTGSNVTINKLKTGSIEGVELVGDLEVTGSVRITAGATGSFSGSFDGTTGNFATLTSPSSTLSGSFSGSFQGDGDGLTNIPASGIVGLNLTQIADSQVSASVRTGTNSFRVASGSNNLFTVTNQAGILINKDTPTSQTASVEILGSMELTGSTLLQSPDKQTNAKYSIVNSQSAWNYSDNVGIPAGNNQWESGLDGSYFNFFNHNTDTATILRFIAGLISESAPAPQPNNRYYNAVVNNNPSLGNSSIAGYVPQDPTGADILYLNSKGFANTGSTIFEGVGTVRTQLSPTYLFTSDAGGSTTVTSSADPELFGLGGTGITFSVSGTLNYRFDDNFDQNVTVTSQSEHLLSRSTFGSPGSGLTLREINTANPSVIPNLFQDGKFTNILSSTFYNGGITKTSVSASGWYHLSASIAVKSGSSDFSTFKNNYTKVFAAPVSNISIPTQTLTFTQSSAPATIVSRSLSGAPYLTDATYTFESTASGIFEPLYRGTSTVFQVSETGPSTVSITSGTTLQNMSGGDISGTSLVYSADGTTNRGSGTIPFRTDVVATTVTATFNPGVTDTNIGASSITPLSFNFRGRAWNRSADSTTVDVTTNYFNAGTFGQPSSSGSMAYFGRGQGTDPSLLTSTSETFLGETYRLKIDSALLTGSYQNGTKFTTGSYDAYNLGALDLQVKPSYLVRPGSNYGYWLGDPDSSKTYKFYARSFRVSTSYGSLFIDVGKTLNNWTSTSDGVSVAIIFNSTFAGGNLPLIFGNSYPVLFDISALTSTSILTGQTNNDFTNPFAEPINVYGNSGGQLSSTKYQMDFVSSLKQILNPDANPTPYVDFVVLVRYTNQNTFTPITAITQSNS